MTMQLTGWNKHNQSNHEKNRVLVGLSNLCRDAVTSRDNAVTVLTRRKTTPWRHADGQRNDDGPSNVALPDRKHDQHWAKSALKS